MTQRAAGERFAFDPIGTVVYSWPYAPSGESMSTVSQLNAVLAGRYEVERELPFPGPGPATQVSVDGGLAAVWTRDGRRPLYKVGGRFVIAATFKTSPGFAITARDTVFRGNFTPYRPHADYDVSPDGSQLLLVNPSASGQWLVVLNWRSELRAKLGAR